MRITHDMTRRAFLGAGFSTALMPSLASMAELRDPRLTARPRPPSRAPEVGLSQIGEEFPRGGILYVPQSYTPTKPAPLMVALHGSGGSASSWSRFFAECEARAVVLMAPDSRARTWDRVHGDFGPDVGFIDSALRYTFERCAVDPERIALVGFSDGASYTLSLGVSNGDLFTHLMAFSPGFSDPVEPIVGSPKVFLSHGTADRSLPISGSRFGIVPMFEMDGYSIDFVEFDGVHEIPPAVATRAFDWFLR